MSVLEHMGVTGFGTATTTLEAEDSIYTIAQDFWVYGTIYHFRIAHGKIEPQTPSGGYARLKEYPWGEDTQYVFSLHEADVDKSLSQRDILTEDNELPTATKDITKEEVDRQPTDQPSSTVQMLKLVQEWMTDESGYDEKTWPEIKQDLEQGRLSSRRLFNE